MSKYIDKQEAIDALGERPISWTDSEYELGKQNQYDEDILALIDVPTVEVEPVRHGRWIIKSNPENGWYKITCSECGEDETTVAPCIGFMPNVKVIWDFCPNCGARMDGGGDNETD